MRECWLGAPPANRAPRLTAFTIDGFTDPRRIIVSPDQSLTARLTWQEPDGDPLTLRYEIRAEAVYASYAGQGEKAAPSFADETLPKPSETVAVKAPTQPGNYRLFVYLYDPHQHLAVANLPFRVE